MNVHVQILLLSEFEKISIYNYFQKKVSKFYKKSEIDFKNNYNPSVFSNSDFCSEPFEPRKARGRARSRGRLRRHAAARHLASRHLAKRGKRPMGFN